MAAQLRQAVANGEYASSSEVVRDALSDWTHKRQLQQNGIFELRRLWQEAREKNGPYGRADDVMNRLERKYQADDLGVIAEYIAADNPRRAVSFIREICAAIERIGEGRLLYQPRADIGPEARLAVVGRSVILFRFANDLVYIERIVYGGRDLPTLFRPS